MLVVITCPTCGHLGRVPQGRIGHKVRCKGCGMTFRPDSATAQPSPEELRKGGGKASPDEEKPPEPGFLGWLKRPAVIDGAISGALGGILSGLIIGGLTGGMHATPRKMEFDLATGEVLRHGSSGVLAGVMGGGLSGFTIGFLGGVFLGGLLGLLAEYFQGSVLTAVRRRALVVGIVTGASVAAIIATYPWIAVGVGLGAMGGGIWSLLQTWERAADTPFTSGFQVEEEETPPQATG
jgi:hypothetical protein